MHLLAARLFTGCWINSAYLCEHPGIFSENSHPGVFSGWPVAPGLFARGDRVTCQGLNALAQWALGPNGLMHVVEFLNNSAAHLHLRCRCRLSIVFFSRTDKSVRSLALGTAKNGNYRSPCCHSSFVLSVSLSPLCFRILVTAIASEQVPSFCIKTTNSLLVWSVRMLWNFWLSF